MKIIEIFYTAVLSYSKILGQEEIQKQVNEIAELNPSYRLVANEERADIINCYFLDITDSQPKKLEVYFENHLTRIDEPAET